MKGRCFILEPGPNTDLRLVEPYGEALYIFPGGARRASIWSDEYRDDAMSRLAQLGFDPLVDRFVVVGHMVPVTIITNTLTATYGTWRALLFDSRVRQYVELVLGQEKRHETETKNGGRVENRGHAAV